MKSATFLLDAWLIARAIDRPLSSIHHISWSDYRIMENRADEAYVKELEHDMQIRRRGEACPPQQ